MQENHNGTWHRYLQSFFSCLIAILNWQEISWYCDNHKKLSSNNKYDSNCCNLLLPVNPRETLINLLDFFTSISAHWHMLMLVFREWNYYDVEVVHISSRKIWNMIHFIGYIFNENICVLISLIPSDAYMRQWTRPSLIQIMAWRRSGAKPLSETALEYC